MTTKTDATNIGERFWARAEKGEESDCWNWRGAINSSGYGSFKYYGKTEAASRVSYSLKHGGIPKGMHVLHRCDNRKCVNPGHLFIGTNLDNHLDKMAKGRQAKGEAVGRAVLNSSDVRFIRAAVRAGFSPKRLRRPMGCAYATIYDAAHGASWKHVEGAAL